MPIIHKTAPCHTPPSRSFSTQTFPSSSSRFSSDTFLPVRSQVWLLDQFGVLHDGQKAYPGAVDAREQSHSFHTLLMQPRMNLSCILSNTRQVSELIQILSQLFSRHRPHTATHPPVFPLVQFRIWLDPERSLFSSATPPRGLK